MTMQGLEFQSISSRYQVAESNLCAGIQDNILVIDDNINHPVAELVLGAGYEVVDLFYYMQAQVAR